MSAKGTTHVGVPTKPQSKSTNNGAFSSSVGTDNHVQVGSRGETAELVGYKAFHRHLHDGAMLISTVKGPTKKKKELEFNCFHNEWKWDFIYSDFSIVVAPLAELMLSLFRGTATS